MFPKQNKFNEKVGIVSQYCIFFLLSGLIEDIWMLLSASSSNLLQYHK